MYTVDGDPMFKEGDIIDEIQIINYSHRTFTTNYYNCHCLKCGKDFLARETDIVNKDVSFCHHNDNHPQLKLWKLKPRYGRLEVLGLDHVNCDHSMTYILCRCDCGNLCIIPRADLSDGRTNSCGCSRHRMSYTRFYKIWDGIKYRCTNPNDRNYHNYGGRGITYDPKWEKFEGFYEDMYESYCKAVIEKGNGDETLISIDRKDVNGNYCKENCQWTTNYYQQNNRRNNHYVTIGNETYSLKMAFDLYGHPSLIYKTALHRINRCGADPYIAIMLPSSPSATSAETNIEERERINKEHYCPIKFIHSSKYKLYRRELKELEEHNPWRQDDNKQEQ